MDSYETRKEPSRAATRVKFYTLRKRYLKWFGRADDVACLTMIWAVRALQSGNAAAAASFLNYPKEAATDAISGEYAIYPWELETFVTSLMTTRKDRPRKGRYHVSNCSSFASAAMLTNTLRDMEGAEYVLRSRPEDIMEEMYRIGQRQFSWQRGPNTEQLYRFAYVYGQGACAEFFEQTHGVSVSDFLCLSTVLFSVLRGKPWTEAPDPKAIGLTKDQMERVIALLSIQLPDARAYAVQLNTDAAKRLGRPLRVAYMPSLLRLNPIIRVDSKRPTYIAPLPDLVMNRATAGLYYDIKQGPVNLLTEANARFEGYIRSLVTGYLPDLKAMKAEAYGPKGRRIDPPDCLVKDGETVVLTIECKTTKLTFEAQFAENPEVSAAKGFEQIAKGIFQLWRFFSHVRRKVYVDHTVSPDALGVVLTMDGWMQMAQDLRDNALARAQELAGVDPDITDEDMRRVVFASVQELNQTLALTDKAGFLAVLRHATADKFDGYGLPEVARECGVPLIRKEYPMDVTAVLPWWGIF
ncbi:hypothetical protein [Nitratireductor sp. PBL-C9]|uniref:hypothetical protein n=1 Tax=Nitratireductor sp. PBL-C9 TaxID=3435013 RepID=UPI003D7CC46C